MKNIDIKSIIIGALLTSTIFLGVAAADKKPNGELPKNIPSLKALAEKGDARAQTKLGSMYFMGNGVPEDIKEGAKWLRKAAEQGDEEAQRWLSQLDAYVTYLKNLKPEHSDTKVPSRLIPGPNPDMSDKKVPSKLIPSGNPDTSEPTGEGKTTQTPQTGTLKWDDNQEWHYKFLNVFDDPNDKRDQLFALRKKLAIAEDIGGALFSPQIPQLKAQIAQLTAVAPDLTGYEPFATSGKYIWHRRRIK